MLGVVADPNQAADLTGHAFAHYAASGIDVTLVCAGGREWRGTAQLAAVRGLGVRDLVLLDYDIRELTAEGYGERFVDAIEKGQKLPRSNPVTVQTYAWFARHWGDTRSCDLGLLACSPRGGRIVGAAGQALLPVVGLQPAGQRDHRDRHTRRITRNVCSGLPRPMGHRSPGARSLCRGAG